jgi:hypothetical protein
MRKYVIIYDKLLEFGGAESVLDSLVKYRKPTAIICSCIDNRSYWERKYKTKILSPLFTQMIKKPFTYKIFYPYIILVVFLSKLTLRFSDSFFIVYSSSAGKYFRIPDYKNAFLYVNYHAKGIRNFSNYINLNTRFKKIILNLKIISLLNSFFLWLENKAAGRFLYIYAISKHSIQSLDKLPKIKIKRKIGILHCPAKINFNYKSKSGLKKYFFSNYYVIISRLYPEKKIEQFLDFLYSNSSINLIVIGEGSLKEHFFKKYKKKFKFTGFLRDDSKYSILKNCTAVLQPTPQEWSQTIVESNLMGIPVIAARSKGMEEINFSISGDCLKPNLLFDNYTEINNLLLKVKSSRNELLRNLYHAKNIFSEEYFHKKLSAIEEDIIKNNS